MSDVRGVFRLKQVQDEQLSNNSTVKSNVWLSTPRELINFETGTI
jgi:hypothetical protein